VLIGYSLAVPWWITVAQSSSWSQPLFAFYLERYRDVSGATPNEASGGEATFGYLGASYIVIHIRNPDVTVDSSKYSGSVTYVSVSSNAQYWQVSMDSESSCKFAVGVAEVALLGMTIQGNAVSLGSSSIAAIDTGTTLIGGPSSVIASIYSNIPGSQLMTGSYANYYEYPCTTTIDFKITIGGFTIKISDQDFNLGHYPSGSSDKTMCTGAAFIQALPSNSPVQWIVGDTALKNVYSVYRYNPPAVGFANLAGAITSSASSVSTTIPDVSSISDAATPTPGTVNGTVSSSASSTMNATSNSSATSSGSSSAVTSSHTGTTATAHVVTATATAGASASSSAATNGAAADATSSKSSASRAGGISIVGLAAIILGSFLF